MAGPAPFKQGRAERVDGSCSYVHTGQMTGPVEAGRGQQRSWKSQGGGWEVTSDRTGAGKG